MRFVQR